MTTPIDGIKFTVDTKELESAVGMVGELGKATQKMANDVKSSIDTTKNLSKAVLDLNSANVKALSTQEKQAKVREAEAQALEAEAKALVAIQREYDASEKASKKVADGKKNVVQATEAETESLSASEKMLQKQILTMQILRGETVQVSDGIFKFSDGLTKSQASQLANMKIAGGLSSELQAMTKSMLEFNAITGINTFDKSASGIQKMNKEFNELSAVLTLSKQGINLTRDEIVNLVRDAERHVQTLQSQTGATITLNDAIQKLIPLYSKEAAGLNAVRAEVKEMEDQAKRTANARIKANKEVEASEAYVAREMHRVAEAVKAAQQGMNITSSNQLVKMEAALRQSGMSAEQASKQLAIYKNNLQALQKAGNDRAVDTISRALGPQITDITVGLATGQSLMTVLLQQGGQLRDQMALAGVAADQMGTAIRKAAGEMVSSVWTTGKGVIGGIAGAFLDLGKGALKGISDLTKGIFLYTGSLTMSNRELVVFRRNIEQGNGVLGKFLQLITGTGMATVFAGGIFTAVTALVAMGVALKENIQLENEMIKTMAFSGQRLGINAQEALTLAGSYSEMGFSASKAAEAISALAKDGSFNLNNMKPALDGIVVLTQLAGVEMDKAVKIFSEINKDPVKGLRELQAQLGNIPPEIIRTVEELKKQGQTYEANRVAAEAAALASKKAATDIVNSYGILTQAGIGLKYIWDQTWDAILGVGKKDTGLKALRNNLAQVEKDIADLESGKSVSAFGFLIPDSDEMLALTQKRKELMKQIYTMDLKTSQEGARAGAEQRKLEQEAILKDVTAFTNKMRDKALTKEQYVQKYLNSTYSQFKGKAQQSEIVKYLEDQWESINKAELKGTASAIQKQENYFKSLEAQAIKHREKMKGAVEDLSESMTKFNQVAETPAFKNLPPELQNIIQGIYEAADEQERWNAFLEQTTKEIEKLIEAQDKWDMKIKEQQVSLEEEASRLDLRVAILGKTTEEQKRLTSEYEREIKLKAIDVKYEKQLQELRKDKGFELNPDERRKREQEIERQRIEDRKLVDREIAINAAEALDEEYRRVRDSISDSIVTALFEGGKAGGKKLRDFLIAELRKPITVFINAVLNDISGGGLNKLLGGSSGGSGGLLSSLSPVKSLFDFATKGFEAFGTSIALNFGKVFSAVGNLTGSSALQAFGTGMKLQASGAGVFATEQGGAMAAGAQSGSALAGAASLAAGIYGGVGVGRAISGGYSAMGGKSGSAAVNTGTAIGAFFGPLGALAGGAIGGVVNRLFGKKLDQAGIKGTFGGDSGFTGSRYEFYKGGLFSSDSTKLKKLDPEVASAFGNQFNLVKSSMLGTAEYFGLLDKQVSTTIKTKKNLFDKSAESISGTWSKYITTTTTGTLEEFLKNYTKDVKLNFKGKSQKQIDELIAKTFANIQEDMAKLILQGTDFAREGEKAVDTLNRLKTNLEGVNAVLWLLGDNLYALTLQSGDYASSLVDIFGGLDKFQSALGNYYEKFYDEEYKMRKATEQLALQFVGMNLTIPKTIEEFKALVNAQDLTTTQGQLTYAALIGISDAFYEVTQYSSQAAEKLKEFSNGIIEYVNQLSMSEGTPAGNYAQAQMLFAQQLGLVKSGDQGAMDNITGYSDRLLELAKGNVGSSYEYNKLVAQVKAELLGVATGTTASTGLTAVTTEGITGTASVSASNAVVEQTATTQSLLINILDKLTQMQGEDRSEGAETVVAIKSINNILKRAENSNSLNVTVVNP